MIAFKRHRKNSIFYSKERKYITARQIGISVNTFSKYLDKLTKMGLIRTLSNGCKIFDKLSKCIKSILGKEDKSFKAFRFVSFKKDASFKAVYASLQAEILRLNITHQEYRNGAILRAKQAFSENSINKGDWVNIRQVSKQLGFERVDQVLSIDESKHRSKTGKNHLSNLLGCSPSTALKRLRNWHRDGIINRTVVTKELLPANPGSFDLLKSEYNYLLINRNTGMYFAQIGSTIEFLK